MPRPLIAGAVLVVMLTACGSADDDEPAVVPSPSSQAVTQLQTPTQTAAAAPSPSPTVTPDPDRVLFAVGDIASCSTSTDEEVAALLRGHAGGIALLGDLAYNNGTPAEFDECFDPAWGQMRRRLRPSPGNHEYHTPGAAGYFGYFGARAGDRGKGWYAFDIGRHWRGIALNSNCSQVGGCHADSPQGRWLSRVLANTPRRHIVAFWHAPRFSTGRHGSSTTVAPFWRKLHRARAALVLNGHDHMYERFAPQTPAGERSPTGIQQLIVGTGGRELYGFSRGPLPATQVRDNTSYGALRLRLEPDGYRWRFIPSRGDFTDEGSRRLAPR